MKQIIRKCARLAMIGVAMAWLGGNAQAQLTTNLFTFDTSATGSWASWLNEFEGFYDTPDHTGNGGGSLYWYQDVSMDSGVQIFNTWGGNPYYAGSPAQTIDLSTATNISFWVKWDTSFSTLGINDFNTQDYASTPGYGTAGVQLGITTASSGTGPGTSIGNTASIPFAASNDWVQVNIPITPGSLADENQAWGLSFFKWSNTSSPQTGVFAFWIDDIQAEYPGVAPIPAFTGLKAATAQGLNIYDDGNPGSRQNIESVVTTANALNYGWVGNATPVTYSVTIAQAPSAQYVGGQVHLMVLTDTGINETAADWNETNAMILFIVRQADGSAVGQLRYKINQSFGNSWLFGTDTNVFGPNPGHPTTNSIVAGYGGLLCGVTNAAGYTGTWSITMNSTTSGTLNYPGGSKAFSFPQLSDAQAFTGQVTVYWGVQANNPNWFQDTVLSSVSITGSPNTLSANLTQPLNPSLLEVTAVSPPLLFTTPANAKYWLQWAPADPSYTLMSAASLSGPWSPVQGIPMTITNYLNTFDTSNYMSNARNYNPPPIAINFEFGDDATASADWIAGPTADAQGNAGSGSVQLKWAFAGGAGNESFVWDMFPTGNNYSGGTLSFDIKIDPSSTAGTNNDYGYLNVVARDGSYTWNPTSLAESLLTAAGGTTGTWAHVSIPLGTGVDSTIRALSFQISNDGNISGTQTVYIDNLQITTTTGSGPTLYNVNAVNGTYITSPQLPSSGTGFFRLKK